MNINGEFLTYNTILMIGEFLVFLSTVTGITILLYVFVNVSRPRAIQLITNDFWFFAKKSIPYIISFMLCQHLSIEFENIITSHHLIGEITSKYYLSSKVILNGAAFVSKHYLFCVKSNRSRVMLFVGYLILVATSETMCQEKYERTAVNISTILLFLLTILIMVRHIQFMPFIEFSHFSVHPYIDYYLLLY